MSLFVAMKVVLSSTLTAMFYIFVKRFPENDLKYFCLFVVRRISAFAVSQLI